MPKKYVVLAVTVFRDGKRLEVKPGGTFDFTDDEIKDIEASESAEVKVIRDPKNEDPAAGSEQQGDASQTGGGTGEGDLNPATDKAASGKTGARGKTTKPADNDL